MNLDSILIGSIVKASEASADWGWKALFDVQATVADFVAEVRAHPDWP